MTDQCAVGSDGQLLDANMIPWFNDPDDARPISAPVANGEAPAEETPSMAPRRSARSVGNSRKLHDALHAEKHDEFGNMTKHMKNSSTSQARRKKPSSNQTLGQVGDDDTDDSDYPDLVSDDENSDDDSDGESDTDNLADMLPSKTALTTSAKARSKKRRQSVKASDADADSRAKRVRAGTISGPQAVPQQQATLASGVKQVAKKNPIYHFFESVAADANGESSPDTSYFKCYHGNRKVLKITKAMKHNTVPLVL
ncbi:hypothetical protein HGRIS_010863 [Hohenbuehelia grisea]|uniref:Uncharacterized protein n=1 Tax=Hohenbuehelia grisea TaxID=104357 RepID=A0ABR3IYC4_9AGAR